MWFNNWSRSQWQETFSVSCFQELSWRWYFEKVTSCLMESSLENIFRRVKGLSVTVYGAQTKRTRIPIEKFLKILRCLFWSQNLFLSIANLQYVVGWVFGELYSSVSGYVVDNIFYGSIFVDNEIYYVDPYRVIHMIKWAMSNDWLET